MVSIHPRLFRRGNKSKASTMNQPHGFNPPPPFQAREPRTSIMRLSGVRFQSTPAFSGEGTDPTITIVDPEEVSIHPRLFRRGNDHYYVGRKSAVMFQSTPAFSGEGTKNNTIKSKPAAGKPTYAYAYVGREAGKQGCRIRQQKPAERPAGRQRTPKDTRAASRPAERPAGRQRTCLLYTTPSPRD